MTRGMAVAKYLELVLILFLECKARGCGRPVRVD